MKTIIKIAGIVVITILIQSCTKKDDNVIKDIDGNVYTSVTIGTQVWMKENLKTTKYRNGDLIGTTTPATLDISVEAAPKYQWAYEGNESNVNTYGRLYTWFAVTDTRGICPTGWHLPLDTEWNTLTNFLGGENVAGGKLKERGTIHWVTPNTGATNRSGFTALPSGLYYDLRIFDSIGYIGAWWCSTEDLASDSCFRWVTYDHAAVVGIDLNKHFGLSVRCVRD